MAWDGWMQFDGNEVINVARTEAYAKNLGVHWLKPVYKNDALPYLVGDDLYRTPLLDNAPWVDDDALESLEFLGLYPLEVTGLEDSTRDATVVQSIADGGAVRGVRFGTKSVVVSGALIASSPKGAEYGFRWLKAALNGAPCGGGTDGVDCNGADLCYLASEPEMEVPSDLDGAYLYDEELGYGDGAYGDGAYGGSIIEVRYPASRPFFDGTACLAAVLRSLRNVTVTSGPSVTAKRNTSDGGAVWTVQFTAVAGNPYEFAAETPIIQGFLDPDVESPWAAGVEPGTYDDNGFIMDEVPCPQPVYSPIFDPLCPALIAPPNPADVTLLCFDPPENWVRRQIVIPPQYVTLWGEMVPVVGLHARQAEVRNVRLRFYADVDESGDPNTDPCAYCGDLLVTYIPKDSTLVIDGVSQTVYVEKSGSLRRRADSLVFRADGKPFEWPSLTCGMQYVVTIDMPQAQPAPPVLDLSLTARVV